MQNDFNFIKWILNNCVNVGFNCLRYDGKIYDLDLKDQQKKLYKKYIKF
jgi:hypothetical protein